MPRGEPRHVVGPPPRPAGPTRGRSGAGPGLGLAAVRTTSRRGFIARLGAALVAAAGGRALSRPDTAEAFHFCGHIYTTAGCPHPTGLPRVDARGRPLRALDGQPVDDLGRPIDPAGRPVDAAGHVLLDPDGRPLPPAPRSRVCLDAIPDRFGIKTHLDGSWYRCCGRAPRCWRT